MPKYLITTQTSTPGQVSRQPRGDRACNATSVIVEAEGIAQAIADAGSLEELRVVAAEELTPFAAAEFSDDAVRRSLFADDSGLVAEEFPDDGAPVYLPESLNFPLLVSEIVDALRASDLVPDLSASILYDSDGYAESLMLEVYDVATNTYRSTFRELKRLLDREKQPPMVALLEVARSLLTIVEESHLA